MHNFFSFLSLLFKRYSSSSLLVSAPQIISMIVGIITLPIILNNLPTKDYGVLQFVLTIQLWMIVFSGGNITLGSKKGIAEGKDGTFLYAFLKRLKLLLAIGILGILVAVFLWNNSYFAIDNLARLFLILNLYLIFGYLPQTAYSEYFIAKKKFKELAVCRIFSGTLTQVGAVLVAFLYKDIVLFSIAQFGLLAITGWISVGYVLIKYKILLHYRKREIETECYYYGLKLIPSQVIQASASYLSNFVIGPFFGFMNLAIFSIATKLEILLRNSFTSMFYSLFYSDYVDRGREGSLRIIKSKMNFTLILSFLIATLLYLSGYVYIRFFLPPVYHSSILYFFILILGFPAYMLQIGIKTMLEAFFYHKELTVIAIVPNILFIVLILLFGLWFGVAGIAFATTVNAWITFALYYIIVFHKESVWRFLRRI